MYQPEGSMPKRERPVADLGLKELAEVYVGAAVARVGKLIDNEDPRIAFEASQLILRLARPHSRGVWELPAGIEWWKDWGDLVGGGRAG